MPEWVEVLVVDILLLGVLLWLTIASAWFLFVSSYYVSWRVLSSLKISTLQKAIDKITLFIIVLWSFVRSINVQYPTPR